MNISCPLRFSALFVWLRLVSCAVAALFFTVPVWALQALPVVSLSIPNFGERGEPANGARRVNSTTLFLREKAVTYRNASSALQSGSVRINRPTTATASRINIGYSLQYFNASNANVVVGFSSPTFDRNRLNSLPNQGSEERLLPFPLPSGLVFTPLLPAPISGLINGLQGDLSPRLSYTSKPDQTLNAASEIQPGTITLDSGISQTLINFTARYSDQIFHRSPGLQGVRIAIFRIFSLPNDISPAFQVQRGIDSALIILDDPENTYPSVINRIPDQYVPIPLVNAPTFGAIELESITWRTKEDMAPGFIFYDDNYEPLTYKVYSSANQTSTFPVNLTITSSNPATQGRPLLVYAVQPGVPAGTTIPITIEATDNRSIVSNPIQTTFNLRTLAFTPTSVAASPDEPTVTISPNPAATNVVIQGQAQKAGVAVVTLLNSVGGIVLQERITVSEGAPYYRDVDVRHLASGMYIVQVEENGQKAARKLIKQ